MIEISPEIKLLLSDLSLVFEEGVQSLWSGYGQIIRCKNSNDNKYYIVKLITPSNKIEHPRGWNTSISHQRKLQSYQVESSFYQKFSHLTDSNCKVPKLVKTKVSGELILLVMEDLHEAGYTQHFKTANKNSLFIAIKWLAYFHAKFMGNKAKSLWPIGSYWHFNTRQSEWLEMPECDVKHKAHMLDNVLNNAKYQTLIHGDAKFDNLCFHINEKKVAAVDFQYIGRGAGVKDLMYLVGSCLDQQGLVEFDGLILNTYLKHLKKALVYYKVDVDFCELSKEVQQLYPVAWADFYRFLLGWNPQSVKICDYMKTQAEVGLTHAGLFNS